MKKKIALWTFVTLAAAAPAAVKADYDTYKAKMKQEDVRKGKIEVASAEQKQEYWKDWVDFSRKQYDKTLKKYGPDSELTEDAREQHAKAVKAMEESREDKNDAQKDLNKNRQELDDAKRKANNP